MDISAKIGSTEAELAELKTQLQSATGEEKNLIRQEKLEKEKQLTELYKHLPRSGKNSALKVISKICVKY